MRPIPVGGDQLTCERVRGVHRAMADADTPEERLEGLFSMMEDFHEKMNYLEVIMEKFYKPNSVREGGTLFQLRSLIDRRNVGQEVRHRYHAVSDFIDLVTDSHVITASMTFLDMSTLDTSPAAIPNHVNIMTNDSKKLFLHDLVGQIVDHFIFKEFSKNLAIIQDGDKTFNTDQGGDHVFNHAVSLMTYGLLRRVSLLTTAAGDGDRALRNWKYSLLTYHGSNKYKYRLEAFLLLARIAALFPATPQGTSEMGQIY